MQLGATAIAIENQLERAIGKTSGASRRFLRFLQARLLLSQLRKLPTHLCCNCEGDDAHKDGSRIKQEESAMTIVHRTVGFAAALGVSALAFALTLA